MEQTEKSHKVEQVIVNGDRGFAVKANNKYLKEKEIIDGICPKNSKKPKEGLVEDEN